jgi:hypothetical protein
MCFSQKLSSVLRGTENVYLKSGYKTVTPIELANCLDAERRKVISFRAVRVFFGCLAMVAVREAAFRSGKRKGRRPAFAPRFLETELCALTGLSKTAVKKELGSLHRSALLQFSENSVTINKEPLPGSEDLRSTLSGKRSPKRPIPVPRAALRFVARSSKASLSKTLLAHIARGLTMSPKTGEISSAGTVKASWIAKTFGLSLRSVKAARKELIELGVVSKDLNSFQRKLNRDGAYFQINLAWSESEKVTRQAGGAPPKSAPRRAASHPKFAPPYKDKKTSFESKNQKTQSRALKLTGVCKANKDASPTLRDVKPEDLRRVSRLRALYNQAVEAGWIRNSEADFLHWVSAAVRAQTVEARSPVRVFLGIVRQGKWEFITQAQEDRARASIARAREGSHVFHGRKESPRATSEILSRLNYWPRYPQGKPRCSTEGENAQIREEFSGGGTSANRVILDKLRNFAKIELMRKGADAED